LKRDFGCQGKKKTTRDGINHQKDYLCSKVKSR